MLKKIYQFKITLLGIEPTIWRRIQVPEAYSFWDFHVAIQDAMGWQDSHLHMFQFQNEKEETVEIGIPDDSGFSDIEIEAGWEIPIKEFFGDIGDSCTYVYDFGDDWRHVIQLEGIFLKEERTKYPRILDGKRACPPEDCGGIPGYEELISIMKDRPREEYESMITWLGSHYYPAKFKKTDVVFDDPKKRFKHAFEE